MIIAKRVVFSASKIEECISISISDIVTLAVLVVNKLEDL